jgi:hypothetical protein
VTYTNAFAKISGTMKRSLPALLPLVFACGGTPPILPPEMVDTTPPPMQPDPTPSNDCASQPAGQTIQATGQVSGFWAGRVEMSGDVTIAAGQKLEICPGTTIAPAPASKLIVQGELAISGSREAMVTFDEVAWAGIVVDGKLSGGYLSMTMATVCIKGNAGSQIDLVAAMLTGCGQGFALENGARFDRVNVLGGSSVYIRGGILTMVDSIVDFRHPSQGPDCMVFSGGGMNLDHVRIAGCHCPIHLGSAPEGTSITNSLIEDAAVPMMISRTSGIFNGNNVIGGSPQLMDIGGGIALDAGGNYWGGGPANTTGSGYTNLDDYSTTPIAGAGPR